jgi:hypothetical protein
MKKFVVILKEDYKQRERFLACALLWHTEVVFSYPSGKCVHSCLCFGFRPTSDKEPLKEHLT